MISEALELSMKGGRVSCSWCLCVVIHVNGWLGWTRDGGGVWYAFGTKGVGRMSRDAGTLSELEAIH